MAVPTTVEEMMMDLPRDEATLVQRLRSLILECLPAATEKAYYGEGIPFYTHHKMICFLWPASAGMGAKKEKSSKVKKGVTLGFCQGYLMANEDGALAFEKRKQVGVIHFETLKDINDDHMRALLFEAGMIDDAFGEKKKSRKATSATRKRN